MTRKHPAGLDVAAFMRRHWQRRPLLIRGALPQFQDPLRPAEVIALAQSQDAQSRLVRRRGAEWTLDHGPFSASRFKQLPRRDWTVLVQDTNHFSTRADRLLAWFDFIPHARVDDVMVSYAVPGGGVGPHVDSYDVFLLQGHGRRRWQISGQEDHTFVPGLPLRILENFKAEEEWVLEAGDMLYLPPGVAHNGIAESECLTWSIGFRAPTDAELVAAFLDHLHEQLEPEGQYTDAGAAPAAHPGEVPQALLEHAAEALARIRWTGPDVRAFAGRFLSEPKQHVFFSPPRRPMSRAQFAARGAKRGIALEARTRLLFSGTMFFINGEAAQVAPPAHATIKRLADDRIIAGPIKAPAAFWDTAHEWYLQGFLDLAEASP